jgi:hypothetical protein
MKQTVHLISPTQISDPHRCRSACYSRPSGSLSRAARPTAMNAERLKPGSCYRFGPDRRGGAWHRRRSVGCKIAPCLTDPAIRYSTIRPWMGRSNAIRAIKTARFHHSRRCHGLGSAAMNQNGIDCLGMRQRALVLGRSASCVLRDAFIVLQISPSLLTYVNRV